jgi:hypothetical protein
LLLSRGQDVVLNTGTAVEMIFQRAVTLDRNRINARVQ